MEIYRIEDLNFKYPLAESSSLKNINLEINQGEFLTICGKSGSGKTTLLRQLKPSLSPHGEKEGRIYFKNKDIEDLSQKEEAGKIGYILQNPDNQIVTDKVWHELAFGLENFGLDNKTIRLRVGEMASYFGIHKWFNKRTMDLSGGQKQLLNLASVMAMQPEVLILDEPTSQLDPIAASDFINTLKQINQDLGVTIIVTEHRLEEIIPICDRLLVVDKGEIISLDRPREVVKKLDKEEHPMFKSMPVASQIYSEIGFFTSYPLTVKEGRLVVEKILNGEEVASFNFEEDFGQNEILVELDEIWFRYDKSGEDVLSNLSLKIRKGQILSILGGNGTGKSTLLSIIGSLDRPYRGKVLINGENIYKSKNREKYKGKIGFLPQDPQVLFLKENVKEDLLSVFPRKERGNKEKKVEEVLNTVDLINLENMHPYDLSGGEQQRLALAKILLLEPELILLDEPTKGMDNFFKEKFGKILVDLKNMGKTIVLVSHDIEFSSRYSDRAAMLFNGEIITENTTREFFAGNSYYTSSANKMIRNIVPEAILKEDVVKLCKAKIESE